MKELFYILIFPGFFFLSGFALWAEYIDRKIHARLQNRIGPPWFQPTADFIKLLAKEDLVPTAANTTFFKLAPLLALTAATTAFLYIPIWGTQSLYSFSGDLIVVLYLLTIPTLCFFIGGWYSTSLYCRLGAVRTVTQLFAYEVPLLMALLAPTILANSWNLNDISLFYSQHPGYWLINLIAFGVALVSVHGKLEKTPFDIPEAETEIVAGGFTEYSGRLLAFFRLTLSIEMIVCSALLAAIFLPFGLNYGPIIAFILFFVKVIFIIILFVIARTIFARLRIDQMIDFCWKYLAPCALLQLLINIILKGILPQ
jgi:NADH-quinone oxidoreductase subunit H